MSADTDPLAAILAEFRAFALRAAEEDKMISPENVLLLADKVEAAVERERVKARRDAEIEWTRIGYEERKAEERPGNAAAMRAALESAHRTLKLVCEHAGEFVQPRLAEEIIHTGAAVERALAAPARNVDRFDEYHDAVDAWHREERCFGRHKDGGTCEKDPLASTLAPVCFAKWLFAPAEGGAE